MRSNVEEIKNDILEIYMRQEHINFLSELYNNQEKITKQIETAEENKRKIIEKISEEKKKNADDPRELRDYINDSESVLEAIERIHNGLEEVLNNYRNIENNFMIIVKKYELKLEKYILQQDIYRLGDLINSTIILEENVKKDNEKNYVLVDSFLNKSLKYDFEKVNTNESKTEISDNLEDNLELRIYDRRVELPYTKEEIRKYMETYPNTYKTPKDVIAKEFILSISMFNRHPILSKFKEAYYLCRTKEMMQIFDSFNYAKSIMFKSNLNSYIIAAVKSKRQLEDYIYCLDNDELENFKHFKITYNVNPTMTNKYSY